MQLITRKSQFSFFEAFSDMIFCTLVMFIVLFVVLAATMEKRVDAARVPAESPEESEAKIAELRQELEIERNKNVELVTQIADLTKMKSQLPASVDDDVDGLAEVEGLKMELKHLLGSNRFTGRRGDTTVVFASDIAGVVRRHWFVPVALAERYQANIHNESAAERREREKACREAFKVITLTQRSYTDEEMSNILVGGLSQYSDGDVAREFVLSSAVYFSALASGIYDTSGNLVSSDQYTARLLDSLSENPFAGINSANATVAKMDEVSGSLPTIHFDVNGEDELVVGGVAVTAENAKAILSAFGERGVAAEFHPSTPDWVMDRVLEPTGYVNRVPAATLSSKVPE